MELRNWERRNALFAKLKYMLLLIMSATIGLSHFSTLQRPCVTFLRTQHFLLSALDVTPSPLIPISHGAPAGAVNPGDDSCNHDMAGVVFNLVICQALFSVELFSNSICL